MFSHGLSPCGSPLLGVALSNSFSSEDRADATNRSMVISAFLFGWQSCGSLGHNSLEVLVATTIPGEHQVSWRLGLTGPHLGGVWGVPLPRVACTSSRWAPGNPPEAFWAVQPLQLVILANKLFLFCPSWLIKKIRFSVLELAECGFV